MLRRDQVPDKTIIHKLNQRLVRAGMSSKSKVTIVVKNGTVTVTGLLQYDNQRRPLMNALRRVDGVRGLVDQMTVKPRENKWK